jgi:anthranilate/para-aminobenzoate synthase component II
LGDWAFFLSVIIRVEMNLKILLINNKESPQISLEKFLKNYGTVDVIHFQSISIWEILKTYIFKRPDLIVLSGSGDVPLNFSLDLYQDELQLIRTTNFPILGVCFGFEAIAAAYGEKLEKKNERVNGLFTTSYDEYKKSYTVWQSHRWYLPVAKHLETISKSDNGVEIIKVPGKKIYGLQFHPEHLEPKNDGKELFEIILNKIIL